jgi:hypothetical protein
MVASIESVAARSDSSMGACVQQACPEHLAVVAIAATAARVVGSVRNAACVLLEISANAIGAPATFCCFHAFAEPAFLIFS